MRVCLTKVSLYYIIWSPSKLFYEETLPTISLIFLFNQKYLPDKRLFVTSIRKRSLISSSLIRFKIFFFIQEVEETATYIYYSQPPLIVPKNLWQPPLNFDDPLIVSTTQALIYFFNILITTWQISRTFLS